MRVFFGLALVSLMSCPPAWSKDWPSSGNFDVLESDDRCALHARYEGPGETEFFLILPADPTLINTVSVINQLWSAKDKEVYDDIFFAFPKPHWQVSAVGTTDGQKSGFYTAFGPDFLRAFASSDTLYIGKSSQVIDRLSLTGSRAALSTGEACLRHVRAKLAKERKDRERLSDLPYDPFAKR